MREIAATPALRDKLADAAAAREPIGAFADYDEALSPLAPQIDIWRTTYVHRLAGPEAIVDWVEGTGLRPFLAPLDADERAAFLALYREAIAARLSARAERRRAAAVSAAVRRRDGGADRVDDALTRRGETGARQRRTGSVDAANAHRRTAIAARRARRRRGAGQGRARSRRRSRRSPIPPTPSCRQASVRPRVDAGRSASALDRLLFARLSGRRAALPVDGETWQVMRLSRNRNWGHPAMIAFLERFSRKAAQKASGRAFWSATFRSRAAARC